MRDFIVSLQIHIRIKDLETSLTSLEYPPVRLINVIVRFPLGSVILPAHSARGQGLQDVFVDEPHVVPEYVLRLEQLQANTTAETEYLSVQTQDVHLELYLAGQQVGAELADEGTGVVLGVHAELLLIAQHVPAVGAEQVTRGVAEPNVGDDLALALDLLVANLARVLAVVVHQVLGQALAVLENARAGFAAG